VHRQHGLPRLIVDIIKPEASGSIRSSAEQCRRVPRCRKPTPTYVPRTFKLQNHPNIPAVNGVYRRGTHNSRPPPFTGDWSSTLPARRQNEGVCETEACKTFADSVIAGRAKNYTDVDPCTDFATYTCANWWDTHDFRADQSSKLIDLDKFDAISIADAFRHWCSFYHV
jgi:hypothetical protein